MGSIAFFFWFYFFWRTVLPELNINRDNVNNHNHTEDYTADGQNLQHKVSQFVLVTMSKMLIYLQISAYSQAEKPLVNLR